jgi:hypothetical protein
MKLSPELSALASRAIGILGPPPDNATDEGLRVILASTLLAMDDNSKDKYPALAMSALIQLVYWCEARLDKTPEVLH